MKVTSVYTKNNMELNSSVIIRFDILLWLFGCEIFSGPSRIGPLVRDNSEAASHVTIVSSSTNYDATGNIINKLFLPSDEAFFSTALDRGAPCDAEEI